MNLDVADNDDDDDEEYALNEKDIAFAQSIGISLDSLSILMTSLEHITGAYQDRKPPSTYD